MTTHYKRIRTEYMEDQAKCLKRRSEDDIYYDGPELGDPPPVHEPCKLPEECELCHYWICSACEKTVPWDNGSDGDGGMLCDECWCKFIRLWQAVEEGIEARRMEHYRQSEAL